MLDLQLPDYRVEPWTPVDSLAWLKAMAWDLKSNYDDEITRARLSAYLSTRRIEQLYPPYPTEGPRADPGVRAGSRRRRSASAVPAGTLRAAAARVRRARRWRWPSGRWTSVPALMGRGDGIGSNSWVVSGAMTKSGKPLLANDPHLAPAIPSLWYQMGLHCRQVSAQLPVRRGRVHLLRHARASSSGTTARSPGASPTSARTSPTCTSSASSASKRRVRRPVPAGGSPATETIKVRGGKDVPLTVRSTRHGPLLSDVLDEVKDAGPRRPADNERRTRRRTTSRWPGRR